MIWNLSQSTGLSIEDILYKWSFENVLLFSRATPSYDIETEEEKAKRKRDEEFDRYDANVVGNFDADIEEE